MLPRVLLLHLLLFYHFFNLLLSNGFGACLLTEIEVKRLRDSDTVLALLVAARPIRIITSCQFCTAEVLFVEGAADRAALGRLSAVSPGCGAAPTIFEVVGSLGCAKFGVTGIACAITIDVIIFFIFGVVIILLFFLILVILKLQALSGLVLVESR